MRREQDLRLLYALNLRVFGLAEIEKKDLLNGVKWCEENVFLLKGKKVTSNLVTTLLLFFFQLRHIKRSRSFHAKNMIKSHSLT